MANIDEERRWAAEASFRDNIPERGKVSPKLRLAKVIKRDRLHDAANKARMKIPSGATNGVVLKDGGSFRLVFDRPLYGSENTNSKLFIRDGREISPRTAKILEKNRLEEKKPKVPGMNWY